jgi:hypothetical protein
LGEIIHVEIVQESAIKAPSVQARQSSCPVDHHPFQTALDSLPRPTMPHRLSCKAPGGFRNLEFDSPRKHRRQSKLEPKLRSLKLLRLIREHATAVHLDVHLGYRPLAKYSGEGETRRWREEKAACKEERAPEIEPKLLMGALELEGSW